MEVSLMINSPGKNFILIPVKNYGFSRNDIASSRHVQRYHRSTNNKARLADASPQGFELARKVVTATPKLSISFPMKSLQWLSTQSKSSEGRL